MTTVTHPKNFDPDSHLFFPFGLAALGWILISTLICYRVPADSKNQGALLCMLIFALISTLDFLASFRLVTHLLGFASGAANRASLALRASYWATIKIACLLLFGLILVKSHSLPVIGLFLGSSTLLIVPLLGGILWYCRIH